VYLPEVKIQGYLVEDPEHWTSALLTVTPDTTYSIFLSLTVQPGIVHLGPPVGAVGEEGGLTGATGGLVGAVGAEGGLTGATGERSVYYN